MASERKVRVLRADSGPQIVKLPVVLEYLRDEPIAYHLLTPIEALDLGAELIAAARRALTGGGRDG